jgi:hypothetical protein
MPQVSSYRLAQDLLHLENELLVQENAYGKTSPEYQQSLNRFKRLWCALRMTRSQKEFISQQLSR